MTGKDKKDRRKIKTDRYLKEEGRQEKEGGVNSWTSQNSQVSKNNAARTYPARK